MKSYGEKLKDPRWQRKRLEVMERDHFTCTNCGDDTKTLNVHHRYYERGCNPWEYPDESLDTLCQDCHGQQTDELKELLALIGPADVLRLIGYQKVVLAATLNPEYDVVPCEFEFGPNETEGAADALGVDAILFDDAVSAWGHKVDVKSLAVLANEKLEKSWMKLAYRRARRKGRFPRDGSFLMRDPENA